MLKYKNTILFCKESILFGVGRKSLETWLIVFHSISIWKRIFNKLLGNTIIKLLLEAKLKAEFTAIIDKAPEGGYWAICPEIPGANGQGETIEEAKESLKEAIELILEDRREDILRGLPDDVIRDKVQVA